jgi:hypothetical protein
MVRTIGRIANGAATVHFDRSEKSDGPSSGGGESWSRDLQHSRPSGGAWREYSRAKPAHPLSVAVFTIGHTQKLSTACGLFGTSAMASPCAKGAPTHNRSAAGGADADPGRVQVNNSVIAERAIAFS